MLLLFTDLSCEMYKIPQLENGSEIPLDGATCSNNFWIYCFICGDDEQMPKKCVDTSFSCMRLTVQSSGLTSRSI